MISLDLYTLISLVLCFYFYKTIINLVYGCISNLIRFYTILYHIHITKKLVAAPRPNNSSLFSWLLLGHSKLILETRKNGGIQKCLQQWKSELPDACCFVIWLGPITPNIVLCDAILVKETLIKTKIYQKSFIYDAIRYVVPEGITNAEGSQWKLLRRLVTPCFHNQVVELLVDTMAETGKEHMNNWIHEEKEKESINIHILISRLTLSIIMKTTIGHDVGTDSSTYHEFGSMMSYTAECLVSPIRFLIGSWLYIRLPIHKEFKTTVKKLEQIVHNALSNAIKKLKIPKDEKKDITTDTTKLPCSNLMDIMLHEYQKSASTFTEKVLRDQLGTFLAAGHDTTAALLSFTIYQIYKHERRDEIVKLLREEATNVLGPLEALSSKHSIQYQHTAKLKYATACLQETLRLDTPGPIIARQATKKTSMLSSQNVKIPIPEGTSIWLAIYLLHRDKKYWSDPTLYKPERWLNKNSTNTSRPSRPSTSYIPFSYGARNCVGQRFAMLEAATLLSLIVYRFDIELDEKKPPLIRETALVNRPRDGLWVKLQARKCK